MKPYSIETRHWDSQFFGYPVANVEILDESVCEINNFSDVLENENYRLYYFFVNPNNDNLNKFILENGGILVDQKTTMSKITETHTSFSNEIIEYDTESIDDNLKRLALTAGSLSRFNVDSGFVHNEFERLYIEWISKSIKKEIALKTFVSIEKSNITGLITLGGNDHFAKIGLLAVDEKYRGRKIGFDLVKKADSETCILGFKTISVVSQFQNPAAIRLYKKCNFEIESIMNVYHLWNKNCK
jgi:dTDP-4-amino-4,6-dideoxy-D-galactose acyltransferase